MEVVVLQDESIRNEVINVSNEMMSKNLRGVASVIAVARSCGISKSTTHQILHDQFYKP